MGMTRNRYSPEVRDPHRPDACHSCWRRWAETVDSVNLNERQLGGVCQCSLTAGIGRRSRRSRVSERTSALGQRDMARLRPGWGREAAASRILSVRPLPGSAPGLGYVVDEAPKPPKR